MDMQQQQALGLTQRWFNNAANWQKDLFCTIWENALNEEQILERSIKLVGQEYLSEIFHLAPKSKFPAELSFSDKDKPPVILKSISNITGVGALASNASLQLENGLNVVYGENGCGKSSYVRILKALENHSYTENILGNVFEDTPEPAKADITFSVDGTPRTIRWTKTYKTKCPIQIYDTATAKQFVDKENEVVYEPKALSMITHMVSIYEQVGTHYKFKLKEAQNQQSPLPQELINHPIAREYEKIGTFHAAEAFAKRYPWGEEQELALISIIESLKESDPQKAATTLEAKRRVVQSHGHAIISLLPLVNDEACEIYLKKRSKQIETKKALDKLIAASQEHSLLKGFGSQNWTSMWNHANAYINYIEQKSITIPVSQCGRCALCQQTLDTTAKERIQNFSYFLTSEVSTEAENASQIFSLAVKTLQSEIENKLNVERINEALISNAIPEEISENIITLYSRIIARCEWLLSYNENSPKERPFLDGRTQIVELFSSVLAKMDAQITALKATSTNQAQQIDRKNQLCVIKWATTNLPIKIQILKLQQIISSCKTNSLTSLKKDLSRLLITDAYVQRFQAEMQNLDKDNQIKVELVEGLPKRGKAYHQVSLRGAKSIGKHKNGDILSEGEFRVVSLAAFLADLTAWGRVIPFIFDDPITSLDQKYEALVAARLIKLSTERQVIVFTHRLAFAQLLNAEAKKYNIKADKRGSLERVIINNLQLRRSPLGYSESPSFLKDISISKAIKYIRDNQLVEVKRKLRDGEYAIADLLIQALCSDFRKIIEQGISQDLLSGIVSRYGREISSLKLPRLYALSEADITLFHDMMSKYSCYEHSQPVETPVSIPEISDIEADLNMMEEWAKNYDKRCDKEAKKARGKDL